MRLSTAHKKMIIKTLKGIFSMQTQNVTIDSYFLWLRDEKKSFTKNRKAVSTVIIRVIRNPQVTILRHITIDIVKRW